MDLNAIAESFGGSAGAIAVWNAVPQGVKSRVGRGYDRLTRKLTHRWDMTEKEEDATLDDKTQRVNNQTITQQEILKYLVPDMAKKISADEALLERAIVETMGESYRKQQNKDAVADEYLKDYFDKIQDFSDVSETIDEDWLNVFSAHAEKASSERTRQLWGRILSGEVRHPGRFSLSTLRCLSEIDQKTAKIFMGIVPSVSNSEIIISSDDKNERFREFLILQQAGLILGAEANLALKLNVSDDCEGQWYDRKLLIKFKAKKKSEKYIQLPCLPLTNVGKELLTLIGVSGEYKDRLLRISNALPRHELERFSIYLINSISEGKIYFDEKPLESWNQKMKNKFNIN